jgi:serine/threonine protein kinase
MLQSIDCTFSLGWPSECEFPRESHPEFNTVLPFLWAITGKLENSFRNESNCNFLISQGDLHSHVRVRKRLRENEARKLFRQMCEVVKTCHEQGIVLRDLKLRKFVFADAERWVEEYFFLSIYRNPLKVSFLRFSLRWGGDLSHHVGADK